MVLIICLFRNLQKNKSTGIQCFCHFYTLLETLACRGEVWEDGMKSFCLLQAIVSQCVVAGYFKIQDTETASLMIWAYMHGLVTIYLKNRMNMFQDERPIERMQQSFELFMKMLKTSL